MTLQGAADLHARLEAIADTFEPVAQQWATDASALMRQRVHSPTGRLRGSIKSSVVRGSFRSVGSRESASGIAARVYGSYRITFQDKGTKAHGPKNKRAMKWGSGDRTIFSRGVVKGVKRSPFVRRSAREALKANAMAAECIRQWNLAGGKGKRYALRTARKPKP